MGTLEYFPAFFGYLDSLRLLDDAQVGRVFRAALRYAKDGTMPDLDAVEMMAFAFIRGDIDRARSKYDDICEKRREAINKRWQNTGNTNEYKCIDGIQKNTSGSKQDNTKQDNTKQHNINDGVASYDAAPARKKPQKKKEFVPPTVDDVREYCREKGLSTIDPEYFVRFYAESDWIKANGEPVRNWKSTVLTWAQRDKERGYDTPKPAAKSQPSATSFDTDEFFDAALQRTYGDNWQMFKDAGG